METTTLKLKYDELALVAFPPDGSRAAFLNFRMIERLAPVILQPMGSAARVDG